MTRKSWWTIGLILVLIVGGAGLYRVLSQKEDRPVQAAWQTMQVRKGELEERISGTGNIKITYREALKTSETGTIESVLVKEGDTVHKGQVLATFEQKDVSTVISQLRGKELELKKRRLDLENLHQQFKEAVDDDKRRELAISIQKQQFDIETIVSDIESLQEEAENKTLEPITAPIDGTLATFDIQAGDSIGGQGATSSALGEVVDYTHLEMVVGVDELDIAKVALDQLATIFVEALPNRTYTGKVTKIAQEGNTSNGVASFDVTLTIDDVTDLKAGMSAEASIIVARKTDALMLPIEAVQSVGNRYFVAVPSSGQQEGAGGQEGIQMVMIEVGILNEDFIEIVSGLKEGDEVVISAAGMQSQFGRSGFTGMGPGGFSGGPSGGRGGEFGGGPSGGRGGEFGGGPIGGQGGQHGPGGGTR